MIVALLLEPDKAFPALVLMGIGWFITMNVIGPRLMSDTVGIHPIVVLAAALIGAKIAGIMGAIFGIRSRGHLRVLLPLLRSFAGDRDRHDRATQAAGGTRGTGDPKPREPVAGVDEDVAEPVDKPVACRQPARRPCHGWRVRRGVERERGGRSNDGLRPTTPRATSRT